MKSYQQLFAELKRRHVFKVAAIYGATAFVVLQLADLLGQGLQLPAEFLSMVTVLVLLGFPFALILAWAFEVTPEGVRRTDRASNEELAAIVAEPASRRWPAGLLALAGVAALVGGRLVGGASERGSGCSRRPPRPAADSLQLAYGDFADDARPSIAVLPFADMSREGDQEYFSDGMTEELLNTLANIRELRVSGRTSTFAYKDRDEDLRTIGHELGVAVPGRGQRAEGRRRAPDHSPADRRRATARTSGPTRTTGSWRACSRSRRRSPRRSPTSFGCRWGSTTRPTWSNRPGTSRPTICTSRHEPGCGNAGRR